MFSGLCWRHTRAIRRNFIQDNFISHQHYIAAFNNLLYAQPFLWLTIPVWPDSFCFKLSLGLPCSSLAWFRQLFRQPQNKWDDNTLLLLNNENNWSYAYLASSTSISASCSALRRLETLSCCHSGLLWQILNLGLTKNNVSVWVGVLVYIGWIDHEKNVLWLAYRDPVYALNLRIEIFLRKDQVYT